MKNDRARLGYPHGKLAAVLSAAWRLVYEQYYGDEVALFGTDNLQKDPHAVTLGLEYTPVPLVTVGTDYKAGTGDSNDFSVNATVNYQIGTPLARSSIRKTLKFSTP